MSNEKLQAESSSDTVPVPVEAIKSPVQKRRQELLNIKNAPKKLDEVFGIIRSESVDEFRTDIKIRGMGNVKLKPQSTRKSTFDHNRLEEQLEQKKIAQRQIAMPEKPATYKKPKPKVKIEEPPTVILEIREPTPTLEPQPIADIEPITEEIVSEPHVVEDLKDSKREEQVDVEKEHCESDCTREV